VRTLQWVALCATMIMLVACGSNSNNAFNGNWSATLVNPDSTTAFTFTTSLSEGSQGNVTVTNLSFGTSSSCFALGTTASGTFAGTGTTNGAATGSIQLTIQSSTSNSNGANALTLQGALNNNTITGSWQLTGTGAGCTGSGSFTMTKM